MPVILATQEAEIRGSQFAASLGKQFMIPYLKNTQHKKELAQVVKRLPSKHKAQSANSSTSPKKKSVHYIYLCKQLKEVQISFEMF
jgi:hypothetical protein